MNFFLHSCHTMVELQLSCKVGNVGCCEPSFIFLLKKLFQAETGGKSNNSLQIDIWKNDMEVSRGGSRIFSGGGGGGGDFQKF